MALLVGIHVFHNGVQVIVLAVTNGAQQSGDWQLALAVHLDREHVTVAALELQPGATTWDQLGAAKHAAGGSILVKLEVNARRADQLGDDDAFGSVDNEGAVAGHQREVADKDLLLFDLACLFVKQARLDAQRRGIGRVAFAALEFAELGLAEVVLAELQFKHAASKILDRGNLGEQFLQALFFEPFEGINLNLDEVRHAKDFMNAGVVFSFVVNRREAVSGDGCDLVGSLHDHISVLLSGWVKKRSKRNINAFFDAVQGQDVHIQPSSPDFALSSAAACFFAVCISWTYCNTTRGLMQTDATATSPQVSAGLGAT